ncbi:hypothetical protein [Echinicola salinicaeni]|uniref:hypothetical protein n=1 Tax=Echinicola salinicaeni TaxID=2762757 RepID=UPI0016483D2B|nr:hypothetical protein [Echinicola salinicaeni]
MKIFLGIFLTLIFSQCSFEEKTLSKSLDSLKEHYKIESESLFIISWDQCDSCHDDLIRMIDKFSRTGNVKVVVITKKTKLFRNEVGDRLFSRVVIDSGRRAFELGLFKGTPIIYYFNEGELKSRNVNHSSQITDNNNE